jgi:carbon-monoxide dehydrogenase large subunit
VGAKYVGAAVRRVEDPRYLQGRGRYVDDITLPGMLHLAFLRSPHAHARIRRIDPTGAMRMPGVVRVLTFADLARFLKPLPTFGAPPPGLAEGVAFTIRHAAQLAVCQDIARFAGEIVAVIAAESRYLAEDAREAIEVEWEPLSPVVDVIAASTTGSPRLHPGWPDNVAVAFTHAIGDAGRAVREADTVLRERFRIKRSAGMPIEPRGAVAIHDRRDGSLTTWNSTQVSHFVQLGLARALDLPPHKIRVVAPDVGGGFGTKAAGYPEDALVPIAAVVLGRPVKWTEDRREHMLAAAHGRDQVHDIELAARRDGTILAVRDRIWLDLGAYNGWGIVLPYNTVAHLLGPYRIRNLHVDVTAVVTTKTPNAPYRGAGRPETVFAMDRAVDSLARQLGIDPLEIRRRNYIPASELPYDLGMPYRDGNPLVYDSGDFPAALEAAVREAGYGAFRQEQAQLRTRGVYRGIGISGYVEGTAIGPHEGATVTLDLAGRVVVATGACSSGQGHETAFAQVAADVLGVPLEWVTVIGGDTATVPFGVGTFASRSAVTAGSSIHDAATAVRAKLVSAAASLLEAAPDDVLIEEGQVSIRGAPASTVPLARVIEASIPTFAHAGVASPDFEATAYHRVPTVTWASAVHVAQVEVDPETGAVTLLGYVVAHDCGKVINPLIVEGQIHGGVAQGIGGALREELVYDERGQLLSGSLMEYAVPAATDIPSIRLVHLECPSSRNPLGIKGLGEGGAISPPAAIASAIEDALAPFDVRVTETPVSSARVRAWIAAGRSDRPGDRPASGLST